MPTRIIQPSFAGGELAPGLYGRVDLGKYQVGVRLCRNAFVRLHGGLSNRPGMQFIGEVDDSSVRHRLITFQFNTEQAYALVFGDRTLRVVRNGGMVTEAAKTITGATRADPVVLTIAGHGYSNGDEVFLSGVGGMTELNGRMLMVANTTADTFSLQTKDGSDVNGTGYTTYTSGGTAARLYEITTPYAEAQLAALNVVQSADVMYLVHPSHGVHKLSRTDHNAWTLTAATFAPSIAAPTGVTATNSTGGGSIIYTYVVTAIAADTGEESLPSSSVVASNDLTVGVNKNTVSWSAVAGAEKYVVYKLDNGLYGFIGDTEATSFDDRNIGPDRSDTPPKARNPFAGAGNYPSCATFYEQRLVFGNSINNPQTIWMSNSANFENFNVSNPAKDDDAVTVTIYAREVNAIRHLVPLDNLITLTSGAEWRLAGASDTGFITPSSIERRPQSYWGSAAVPPLVVGNTLLFVQDKGSKVRDLSYSFESDGYAGSNLSVLAEHLFEGHTVEEWAFAKVPHSLVWCVRDDGQLLTLTYLREHEVWGWAQHETDGVVESVCAVSEGDEDAVYLIVKRTVGGRDVRYIERLHSRTFTDIEDAFFVDSGLSYDGPASQTLGGLWHLEGCEVVALADGNVFRGLTVVNGAVTLNVAVSKAHVGLAYTTDIRTLPVDLGSREGTVQGRRKRVGKVTLRVEQSRGMFLGPAPDRLTEWKQRATEAWGEAIQPFTGDVDIPILPQWNAEGDLWIRQSDPLPLTLLAAMPEISVGG